MKIEPSKPYVYWLRGFYSLQKASCSLPPRYSRLSFIMYPSSQSSNSFGSSPSFPLSSIHASHRTQTPLSSRCRRSLLFTVKRSPVTGCMPSVLLPYPSQALSLQVPFLIARLPGRSCSGSIQIPDTLPCSQNARGARPGIPG